MLAVEVFGGSAVGAAPLAREVEQAMHEGRPCLLWCDGADVRVITGRVGDDPAQLLRVATEWLPELVR